MRLSSLYQRLFGRAVLTGPFRGMRFQAHEVYSNKGIGAKILGTYELELRDVIEALCRKNYDQVIDVGGGDGYYAVGLALRNPRAKIIVFEGSEKLTDVIRKNAATNRVSGRIEYRGLCDSASLQKTLQGAKPCFILMDVEGAERELLDPALVPALLRCDIVVEIHDFFDPQIGSLLRGRFEKTHAVREIWSAPRTREDLPRGAVSLLSSFTAHRGVKWMGEGRPPNMRWFHLAPEA